MTNVEFDAWLCGIGAFLPGRSVETTEVDDVGRLVIKRVPSRVREATLAGIGAVSAALQTIRIDGVFT
jgi:hypothetical protein